MSDLCLSKHFLGWTPIILIGVQGCLFELQ